MILSAYEKIANPFLRKKALDFVLDQIRREDDNTDFLDIGPVCIFLSFFSLYCIMPIQGTYVFSDINFFKILEIFTYFFQFVGK